MSAEHHHAPAEFNRAFAIGTDFVVPVLYCSLEEFRLRFQQQERDPAIVTTSVGP